MPTELLNKMHASGNTFLHCSNPSLATKDSFGENGNVNVLSLSKMTPFNFN